MADLNDVRSATMLATAQIVASIGTETKGDINELTDLIEKVARALYRSSDPLKVDRERPPTK